MYQKILIAVDLSEMGDSVFKEAVSLASKYEANLLLLHVLSPEEDNGLFGNCYAMDGGYKGWNPYRERHLAIFVNCFCSRAN